MVRAHLKPFPIAAARASPFGFAATDDVDKLKYWAWIARRWTISFALSYDDGVGDVAVPIPDFQIDMGVNLDPRGEFATQKDILDYRTTVYQQSDAFDGDKAWTWSLVLGATMFYGPVRSGGVLINSGGDYEYFVGLDVSVTTDANNGLLSSRSDVGGGAYTNPLSFDGTNVPLFQLLSEPLVPGFSGTIGMTVLEEW